MAIKLLRHNIIIERLGSISAKASWILWSIVTSLGSGSKSFAHCHEKLHFFLLPKPMIRWIWKNCSDLKIYNTLFLNNIYKNCEEDIKLEKIFTKIRKIIYENWKNIYQNWKNIYKNWQLLHWIHIRFFRENGYIGWTVQYIYSKRFFYGEWLIVKGLCIPFVW